MSREGNVMSDLKVGEALIKEVIEEELEDVSSEEVPPLTPLPVNVMTEQEKKMATHLTEMIIIGADVDQDDKEFQEVIEEELEDVPPEEVLPLTTLAVNVMTGQEERVQLGRVLQIIGEELDNDNNFQVYLDDLAHAPLIWENIIQLAHTVFDQRITWGRIVFFCYCTGRIAVRKMTVWV